MSEIFLSVLNMSISAGWIVLAVLLLRAVLKKAPKYITVLLWAVVAIRLVLPVSIESVISLIPSAQTVSPEIMTQDIPGIDSGIPIINEAVNPIIFDSFAPTPAESVNPMQVLVFTMSIVWVVGTVIMAVYAFVSYIRVRKSVDIAVLLKENVFQCETVKSPFVLGVIRPRIYLPFGISENDAESVIAHEKAHIRRKDHIWKPLGFLLLTVHWMNPLMWLAYIFLCRDIELACDEKVVKDMSVTQKADYSRALLACSVNRRLIVTCPLAFGEVGVKERVKKVLNYKKPGFWIIIAGALVLVITALCFLTSPKSEGGASDDSSDSSYQAVVKSDDDICMEILVKYIQTGAVFDYEENFALFPEALVKNRFTDKMALKGYGYDEAMENIKSFASVILPWNKAEVGYSIESVETYKNGDEGFAALFEYLLHHFEYAEVDTQKISSVKVFRFSKLAVRLSDRFEGTNIETEFKNSGIKFFEYEGKWYLFPNMFDDDLPLDLGVMTGDAIEEALNEYRIKGEITAIDGEYIRIDHILLDTVYMFYAPELVDDFKVGDYVEVGYYAGYSHSFKGDDSKTVVAKAVSVKITERYVEITESK